MTAMTTETAADELRTLLEREGGGEQLSLASLWAAVQRWATVPVDGISGHHADLILFETTWLEREAAARAGRASCFVVSFTRQFQHADDDERYHGAMEQILVELLYPHHPDLRRGIDVGDDGFGAGAAIWGTAGRSVSRWKEAVERHPTFQAALLQRPSGEAEISQGLL
jgi:hypothetical protein